MRKKRREQIGAAGYDPVIGQQDRVVILHQRLQRVGKLRRAGRAISRHGNASKRNNEFAQQRLVERKSRGSVSGGNRRMRVANRVNVGPATVNQQMHRQLRGGFTASGKFPALEVGDDQIIGRHQAFADARGRSQNAA